MSEKPAISISGVSKRYRLGALGFGSLREELENLFQRKKAEEPRETEFWALRDVSFDLPPGSATGIIGRNGAGKSTLLKILSRITEPTSGEIRLRGRVGSLLEVGTGFHPELSGRDNIFLNGAVLGMSRREVQSKFDDIVDFAEIGQFIDTPVKRYSSGMYVKLGFSVAAHLEPEILIVDEVLAVGDAAFQRKCIDKMQQICQSHGRTILFVSHAMATIRRLCRRCVLLEKGVASGPMSVEEAIERYSLTGAATDLDIDVSRRERSWGTDGAVCRMLRIRVAGDGKLRFNSPAVFEVLVSADRPIDQAMVGLSFNTVDGQRILTLDSDGGGEMFSLREGHTWVQLRIDRFPLHPTRFYVSAGVCDRNHFFDILDSFALWEIETSERDFETDRGFGGCRIAPSVKLQPVAGSGWVEESAGAATAAV